MRYANANTWSLDKQWAFFVLSCWNKPDLSLRQPSISKFDNKMMLMMLAVVLTVSLMQL